MLNIDKNFFSLKVEKSTCVSPLSTIKFLVIIRAINVPHTKWGYILKGIGQKMIELIQIIKQLGYKEGNKMGKYLFGILVILLGVYFLLDNLGYDIMLDNIIKTYWPVLLIALGVKEFFKGLINFVGGMKKRHWTTGSLFWGLITIIIGVIFLGNNLEWFDFGIRDAWNIIWPIIIIFIGLNIIFGGRGIKDKRIFFEVDTDKKFVKLNKRKLWFGESNYGIGMPWTLDDLNLWHGIGETNLDLTTAIIPEREVFIDITGLIGEVTVMVPQDLAIKVNVDVRLGDVTVLNHNQSGTSRFITYTSEDYDKAIKKVNLQISLNIGDVTVKQVD